MSNSMDLGKAWIIYSQKRQQYEFELVSIINARYPDDFVKKYMEQHYNDSYALLDERIEFKKHKMMLYSIKNTSGDGSICCGENPIYRARYCHKLVFNQPILKIKYFQMKNINIDKLEWDREEKEANIIVPNRLQITDGK